MTKENHPSCNDCRFWSQMVSEVRGGSVFALCLATTGLFTTERDHCDDFARATHGVIDEPTRNDPGAPPWPKGYDTRAAQKKEPTIMDSTKNWSADVSWSVLLAACETASADWRNQLATLRNVKAEPATISSWEASLEALERSKQAIYRAMAEAPVG